MNCCVSTFMQRRSGTGSRLVKLRISRSLKIGGVFGGVEARLTYNTHILSSAQRSFYSKSAESLSSVCIRLPFLRFLFLRRESLLKICQQHMYKYITRKTSHLLGLGQTKAEKAVPLRLNTSLLRARPLEPTYVLKTEEHQAGPRSRSDLLPLTFTGQSKIVGRVNWIKRDQGWSQEAFVILYVFRIPRI